MLSNIESGHRKPIYDIQWLPPQIEVSIVHMFCTGSTANTVCYRYIRIMYIRLYVLMYLLTYVHMYHCTYVYVSPMYHPKCKYLCKFFFVCYLCCRLTLRQEISSQRTSQRNNRSACSWLQPVLTGGLMIQYGSNTYLLRHARALGKWSYLSGLPFCIPILCQKWQISMDCRPKKRFIFT